MEKPKNKWWSVKKFDVGRELANPDYVLWAGKRIAALEKDLSKQADNIERVQSLCVLCLFGDYCAVRKSYTLEVIKCLRYEKK